MTAPTPETPLVPYWVPLALAAFAAGGLVYAVQQRSFVEGIVALLLGGGAYFLQTKIT